MYKVLLFKFRRHLCKGSIFYFKLAYIGHFSVVTQKIGSYLIKRYCNDLDIKLLFSSFKIGKLFGVKDPMLTLCRPNNRVSDKASHLFKHLQNSEHGRALCSVDCFHIFDHASTSFQLKIKEAFHIQREQPSLNQQLHHVNLKLSF